MVDEKVPLKGCPRADCDEPIIEAIRTDEPFQIRRQNMVADKWCLIPRLDPASGDFFVYAIRHGEIEDFKTGNEVREEERAASGEDSDSEDGLDTDDTIQEEAGNVEDAPEASADPNENAPDEYDAPDERDLPAFERAIVRCVKGDGSATQAAIQGAMLKRDKSPSEVKVAVEWLVENDYLIEVEDAVYKPA